MYIVIQTVVGQTIASLTIMKFITFPHLIILLTDAQQKIRTFRNLFCTIYTI